MGESHVTGLFYVRIHMYIERQDSGRIGLAALPGKLEDITEPQKIHILKSTFPVLTAMLEDVTKGAQVTLFPPWRLSCVTGSVAGALSTT